MLWFSERLLEGGEVDQVHVSVRVHVSEGTARIAIQRRFARSGPAWCCQTVEKRSVIIRVHASVAIEVPQRVTFIGNAVLVAVVAGDCIRRAVGDVAIVRRVVGVAVRSVGNVFNRNGDERSSRAAIRIHGAGRQHVDDRRPARYGFVVCCGGYGNLLDVRWVGTIPRVDRENVTLAQLTENLAAAQRQYSDLGVLIRGDATGQFQRVAEVLNACKQAGIAELGISVRLASKGDRRR